MEHVNVYTAGEDGYKIYRIPSLEIAPDGTLLAFAEGESYPVETVLCHPPAAYSDLVVLKDGTAGCLWGRAQNPEVGNKIDNICFTRLGISHLEPQGDSNP